MTALTGHEGSVYALERSGREDRVFTGGGDRIVTEWDLSGQEPPRALVSVGAVVYSLCHIPDRNWLLIGTSGGNLHILDLVARRELHNIIVQHSAGIFDIRYHEPTGNFFSAAGDGTIAIGRLDAPSVVERRSLAPGHKVRSIDLHPGGEEVAFACGDGTIRIYSLKHFEERLRIKAHELSANVVAYESGGKYLLSGGRDAHLCAWNIAEGGLIRKIPAHNYAIYSISFSPDQRYFATASRDKTVKIWDADAIDFRLRIDREKHNGHKNSVNKVLWTRYRNRLVSTGDDRAVLVWEVEE
jgi:WD40 repeat protein